MIGNLNYSNDEAYSGGFSVDEGVLTIHPS